MEFISVRLRVLEARDNIYYDDDAEELVPSGESIYPSLQKHMDAAIARLLVLEERANIQYTYKKDSGGDGCVVGECKAGRFDRMNNLRRHYQRRNDYQHLAARYILEATMCFLCNQRFDKSGDLIRHEKDYHQLDYQSRLDGFLPLFGETL